MPSRRRLALLPRHVMSRRAAASPCPPRTASLRRDEAVLEVPEDAQLVLGVLGVVVLLEQRVHTAQLVRRVQLDLVVLAWARVRRGLGLGCGLGCGLGRAVNVWPPLAMMGAERTERPSAAAAAAAELRRAASAACTVVAVVA